MKVELGRIYDISSGGTPSKKCKDYYDGGKIKWVKTGDLKEKYLYDTDEYITQKGLQNSSAKLYPSDTVLVAMYGATIGATSILKSEACTNQACAAFIKNNKVIPEYLYYFFKSKKEKFIKDGVGGAQPNISAGYLRKVKIDLISIGEQRKIVKKLGKIEELIGNEQEQIRQFDILLKSQFVEMFGDTITNSLNWEEHRLDEYIEFLTSGSRGWAQYFVDEENALFITIKNVKNNHISLDGIQYINAPTNKEAERTKIKTGDLLISITADLGRTGVVDEEIADKGAYINQHLSLVRLNQKKVNPIYISHFLETDGGKRQFESKNQNGVKAGLNFDAIKSLKILIPPLERQNQFAAFVHQVDKLKVPKQRP